LQGLADRRSSLHRLCFRRENRIIPVRVSVSRSILVRVAKGAVADSESTVHAQNGAYAHAGVIPRLFPSILLSIDESYHLLPFSSTAKSAIRSSSVFVLDQRLLQDTLPVGDFPLCRLLLSNDSQYPWFILVPRKADVSEVFQLSDDEQLQLWKETTSLSRTLQQVFEADKMNVAALGNVVSQLHMHVIVRRRGDIAWPAPVWGKHPAVAYTADEALDVIGRLKAALATDLTFVEVANDA